MGLQDTTNSVTWSVLRVSIVFFLNVRYMYCVCVGHIIQSLTFYYVNASCPKYWP